jgi:hypothetical protein
VTGVVHPNVDALEMMESQSDGAIDFFAMAHVARHGHRSLGMPNAGSRRIHPAGVAR